MNLPTVKPPTKAEIDAATNRKREKEIERDIRKIDDVLQKADPAEMEALHRYLDGKYQSGIMDWGHSMYGYIDGHGFSYELLCADSLKDNLATMKPKLEGFIHGWNAKGKSSGYIRNPDVSVTVNNTVNISISFEETRQKVEDMTALSREQTDEILEKINELEEISKENSSRKTKWEKVKPIIAFALDKGADVAIAILTLVMQMKLGG
ncbi:MAG: hypothetical protein IKU58_01660 [Clostridia bacterium]|nr:hypothetical protein [Clostridia bacterium]